MVATTTNISNCETNEIKKCISFWIWKKRWKTITNKYTKKSSIQIHIRYIRGVLRLLETDLFYLFAAIPIFFVFIQRAVSFGITKQWATLCINRHFLPFAVMRQQMRKIWIKILIIFFIISNVPLIVCIFLIVVFSLLYLCIPRLNAR